LHRKAHFHLLSRFLAALSSGEEVLAGGNTMKRFDLLAASLLTTAVALGSEAALAEPPQLKPNVVVIMTDDIGWGDLGSYVGGAMRGAPTPTLDRLAAEGMCFVNYYGQASCTSPSARESSSQSRRNTGRSAMQ
jgi:sulfatase-like protein